MAHGAPIRRIPLSNRRSLFSLVENRSAYTLGMCELNVFETYRRAENVELVFGDLVLTSMLTGKKVMHLFGGTGFDYHPGESVIVPPNEAMRIDFPEASDRNPTQCIALAISGEQIRDTFDLLNERYPKVEPGERWQLNDLHFHLVNNRPLADTINRIIQITMQEGGREKDALAGLALRELLVRLMQTQARRMFEANYLRMAAGHRFAYVMQYIRENLSGRIDLDELSRRSCMSRASFFRKFKETFGYSPLDYIVQQRIRLARELLSDPGTSVTQACYSAGFQNLNHFIRIFKQEVGCTPGAYQRSQQERLLPG